MRLQPIVSGVIIGGAGYAMKSFGWVDSPPIYWGAIGLGVLLIILGLFMRRRY